ncbi:hypothetical protein GCM10009555_005670 [Acrocarpospora macrocephala]|uniref:Stress-response A/B barrel domain-containing protein n=1 Tax=Acrocarpospora macrocephala TaxID=150177 RepID=A0A5M3X195_9ACTN|nr:Dabb family protein [Acrocarpospora macrocephala]GES14760.1 hypothetical protein Amac_083570 [Acrocarpospora macrocephala]
MSVQRVVFFGFDESFSPGDAAEMTAIVSTWRQEIPGLRQVRIGPALFTKPEEPGPGYVLSLEFGGQDDLEAYKSDPAHRRLSAWLKSHDYRVRIFDFEFPGERA